MGLLVMSGLGDPRVRRPVWLWVTVALVLLGFVMATVGLYMVGGLGWTLLVTGAVIVVGALTLLPT